MIAGSGPIGPSLGRGPAGSSANLNGLTITATTGTLTVTGSTTLATNVSSPAAGETLMYNGTAFANSKAYTFPAHRKPTSDGASTTPYTEKIIFQVPAGYAIEDVLVFPDSALASNDTNYAQVTVRDGVAGTTIATFNTKTSGGGGSGNWTGNVPLSMKTLNGGSLSDASLASAANATFEITKPGGTGVSVGPLTVQYTIYRNT